MALVLVSHSALVARGTAELAAQMAPDVRVVPAGGLPVAGAEEIGTSLDRVLEAITQALAEGDVVVLTDLGSAVLTSEAALEMLDDDDAARVRLPDAPLVEGAVAAAVAAQQDGDADAVARAAEGAGRAVGSAPDATVGAAPAAGPVPGTSVPAVPEAAAEGPTARRTAVVRNPLGLHARPAALLARHVAGTGVPVRVGGVDGASVLALMALGSTAGDELVVEASGPGAEAVVDSVVDLIEGGFGETG